MENCQYQQVNTDSVNIGEKVTIAWKPFLRQVLICSGMWNSFFTMGLLYGAPTVLIPQLRREANSTDAVSPEMGSWLSSIHGYAALPWVIILPLLSAWIGRKYPFLIVSVITLFSYIFFYLSTSIVQILITEIFLNILSAATLTVCIINITEYTSPRYRGLYLTLKSASFNWGIWVSNALGTFYHWRTIAALGIICSIYSTVTTFYWCESPYWLASMYRFEECTKAHRWIKGNDKGSEKELKIMIQTFKEYREKDSVKNIRKSNNYIVEAYNTVVKKEFLKPLVLSLLLLSLYHFTGKLVVSIYAIDIIKKITSTESTAYMGMLLLDAVTVTGMYVGCGLSKVLKRRTLLLTGSFVGAIFLFSLSLYLYLINLSIIAEDKYVSLTLLTIFCLSVSVGPIIMSTSIYAELIPTRFKTPYMLILGVYALNLMSTSLKIAPLIFTYLKLHGAFLLYGILTTTATFVLYIFLPETKDKTLKEIENCFVGEHKQNDIQTSLVT